jgi:transposase-like protein
LFNNLSKADKDLLLEELATQARGQDSKEVSAEGKCPYCKHTTVVKNGIANGVQRYLCKACKRNFNKNTGTSIQGVYKKDKFEQYKTIMFTEGFLSLKIMAKRLSISIQTAFDWRHRILVSLKQSTSNFKGITELDDVWMLYSQKGRKGLDFSRKRGGSKRKGDNDFQVKMLIVADRNKTNKLSVTRIGRIKAEDIKRKISEKIDDDITLVSDKHSSISSFAIKNNIKHVNFKASEHVADKEHHVQTVNGIASRFKGVFNHYLRGVSTKYLQNYANWFGFMETYNLKDDTEKIAIANISLEDQDAWDKFTNIEVLYENFIKNFSKRTYRCPIKRKWKTQIPNELALVSLEYL